MRQSIRRILALALALVMVLGMVPAMAAGSGTPVSGRTVSSLNGAWSFQWQGADQTDLSNADTSEWENVTVPHCWNADDGADGGGNYKRGVGWYSRTVSVTAEQLAGRVFFECYGASQQADVYINGTPVGNHKGGYTTFRYDITDELHAGENRIDVKVDNTNGGKTKTIIAPIVGDFTVYGGMYRDVNLVFTAPVHVDAVGETCPAADGGFATAPSSGLYLTTSDVSAEQATLGIKAKIVNDGTTEKTVTVKATLKEQNAAELDWLTTEIPNPLFDPKDMGNGSVVKQESATFPVAAGSGVQFDKTMTVANPHLWNGLKDPFRYEVELQVTVDGQVVDTVSDYVGFRFFEVTDQGGFFLNGVSYPLRGVSRHQDWPGKGYAISRDDHREDFGLIYEIGANSVRLAHYPQDPYFYNLCDQFGLVVWAEIPFIGGHNDPGTTEADASNELMRQTTKQQLRELILQQYNRPGICVWGLENEVGHQANSSLAKTWIADMNDLAHTLDPSRLTTMATNVGNAYDWESDLIAWNRYPGWYGGNIDQLGSIMDGDRSHSDPRPIGISEYGGGANITQHEYNTRLSIENAGGSWHPEEFQSDLHEEAVKAINTRPWLWCTYVWNMFDFGSDGRNEGNQPGINDKGLITFDRQTKKDSFYLYKANWNQTEHFVHLTSRRWNPREEVVSREIKVYSNCDAVTLTVNGQDLGTGKAEGNGVFTWSNVSLDTIGDNVVVATGTKSGQFYTDTVTWQRTISTSTALTSQKLAVDNAGKTIGLAVACTAGGLEGLLWGNNVTFKVYESDGTTEVDAAAAVLPGMKLTVTAENGQNSATYTFVSMNLSFGRSVTASSVQTSNDAAHAVDFNGETRWAAGQPFTSGSQWITVDLGEEYHLTSIDIDWFNSSTKRAYYYEVQVSTDNKSFTTVVDRSGNTVQGLVHDSMGDAVGRYVRVLVTGCSAGTGYNASICEIEVNGWQLSSEKYEVDAVNRVITVPSGSMGSELYPADFIANLAVGGNCTCRMDSMKNYYLVDGDTLILQVDDGTQIRYAVEMPSGDDPVYGIVSVNKPVTFSAEEGASQSGESTLAANLNDGDPTTRWAAPQYTPGGEHTHSGTRKYPEWVTIDLGRLYELKDLRVLFYKHGANNRAYQYEILGSETGEENSFTQLVDAKSNSDKGGDFTHAVTGRARYIKLNVTGCSLSDTWACASVHEFEVRGRAVTAAELATGVSFADETMTLRVNEKKTPAFEITPADLKDVSVTLTSSDPEIVQVEGESLVARKEGSAVITISVDGRNDLSDTLQVTVSGVGPISVGKPVTFSAEEGVSNTGESTLAANLNDGDPKTRWAAPQYTSEGKPTYSGTRKYPEWVTIDLGRLYDVSRVELLFYKHGENNRAYQYELQFGKDAEQLTTVVDQKNNTDQSGEHTHTLPDPVRARYVKLNVTGCSRSDTWACASVYECSVYGDPVVPAPHSVTIDDAIANGTVTADKTEAEAGAQVTLTVTPDNGYRLKANSLKVYKTGDDSVTVDVAEKKFTMPDHAVTVTAEFEADDVPTPTQYDVTYALTHVTKDANAPDQVEENGALSVTLTADGGYDLPETISVSMGGTALTEGYTYEKSTGTVTIPSVTGDVVITAVGVKEPEAISGTLTLNGTAKYGAALEANLTTVIPAEAQESLTYAWTRSGNDATIGTESAYTLTAEDIGKTITLTVTGTGSYTGTLSATSDVVAKADGPAAPVGITADACTTEDNNDGKLTGVTTDMEYRSGTGEWERVTGEEITGLAAGSYELRVAETETHQAGATVQITVPAYNAPAQQPTPEAVFDAADMSLSNVTAGMKYSVDGGATWIEIGETSVTLDSVTLEHGILVYLPGDGENSSDSNRQTIALTQANAPVGVNKTDCTTEANEDGSLTVVNADMEYKASNDQDWLPITGDSVTGLTNGSYLVRVAAKGTALASESVTIVIAAFAPPSGPDTTIIDTAVSAAESAKAGVTVSDQPASSVPSGTRFVSTAVMNTLNEAIETAKSAKDTAENQEAVNNAAEVLNGAVATFQAAIQTGTYVRPSDSGSGGSSGTKTETEKNPDGSVTTIVTKPNGTVTETTKRPDGTTEVRETKKDGTVTETVKDKDGNQTVVETKKDGTVTETVTQKDGSKSETVTNPDGSLNQSVTTAGGVKTETERDAQGNTTVNVTIPEKAAEDGETVTLPIPAVDASKDNTVTVNTSKGTEVQVEVPVKDAAPGTVAVIVNEDGTETIVKTSVPTENGLVLTVEGGATVKIVDNSKDFADMSAEHWAAEAVAFVTSRELFNGTGEDTFDPSATTSRAMLFTVLARLDGVDTEGGETWYDKAMAWSVEAGVSDGTMPEADITREQLITMLHRYAGQPAVAGGDQTFADGDQVSDWAAEAMDWAVKTGILTGKDGDRLDPAGTATRAEVAIILQRFVTARVG